MINFVNPIEAPDLDRFWSTAPWKLNRLEQDTTHGIVLLLMRIYKHMGLSENRVYSCIFPSIAIE